MAKIMHLSELKLRSNYDSKFEFKVHNKTFGLKTDYLLIENNLVLDTISYNTLYR